MMGSFRVGFISREEYRSAMALCWRVFDRFESGIVSLQGMESFSRFINDETLYNVFINGGFPVAAAYDGDTMIGVAALRSGPHLSLLFVEEDYQRMGVGTALVDFFCEWLFNTRSWLKGDRLTVNASTVGAGFYRRIGFEDTGPKCYKDGINYIPMELQLEKRRNE
ncbi:MAG: GNAT family N-acetyltransferase [Lachnospiraceae bacterium]|nr:GNAT family N-acetyltransferase [Lachnospiraceae bacterium]